MSDPPSTVIFRRAPKLLDRRTLHEFAEQLSREVAGGRKFVCMVSDDRELRRLNREFLGKDYPADVLSFPEADASEIEMLPGTALGEIAISAGRAAEQAEQFGHSVEDEIKVLMLHGVLHLLGMDHERDRGAMARAESRWRKRLGLSSGLIQRVQP